MPFSNLAGRTRKRLKAYKAGERTYDDVLNLLMDLVPVDDFFAAYPPPLKREKVKVVQARERKKRVAQRARDREHLAKRIVAQVKSTPGANLTQLAAILEVNRETLRSLLGELIDAGLVEDLVPDRQTTYRRFFLVADGFRDDQKHVYGALAHPTTRRFLAAVAEHPGIYGTEVRDMTGLHQVVVSDLARRFRDVDVLRVEAIGSKRRYWINDPKSYRKAVARVGDRFEELHW